MAIQLAVGNTAATSPTDLVIPAGSQLSFYLVPAAGKEVDPVEEASYSVYIQRKDDSGNWYDLIELGDKMKAIVVFGAGTFRVRRPAQTYAIGVETA